MGVTGSDGRFAIFPDYAVGRRPRAFICPSSAMATTCSKGTRTQVAADGWTVGRPKGGATLDINFKNAPPNMSTSTSMGGLFQDLSVRRSSAIPKAGVDIYAHPSCISLARSVAVAASWIAPRQTLGSVICFRRSAASSAVVRNGCLSTTAFCARLPGRNADTSLHFRWTMPDEFRIGTNSCSK